MPDRRAVRLAAWRTVATAAVASYPAWVWLLALPVQLALSAKLLVASGLMLGSCGGFSLAALASARSRLGGAAVSLLLAAPLAWHTRELLRWPEGIPGFGAFIVASAAVVCFLANAVGRTGSTRSLAVAGLAAAVLSPVLFAGAYAWSPYHRWVLLRHTKSIGVALHYALDSDPASLVEAASGHPVPDARPALQGGYDRVGPHPNIVFILIDTLRADALRAWGGSNGDLAVVDRLAEQSVAFTNVLANASWTRASVGSMFTGLHPEQHGARDTTDGLRTDVKTIAESLQERGYQTAAIVSNYGAVGRGAGFDRGFETFVELREVPYARAASVRRAAEAWLERAPTDRPFFLYLHFLDPHPPYLAGEAPSSRRPAASIPAYRAELRQLDAQLAGLLARIRFLAGGDTWLLVASDHGEEFGEHGALGHGHSLYGELVHIPLILYDAGHTSGAIDVPLEGRDVFDLLLSVTAPGFEVRGWAEARARPERYASIQATNPLMAFWRPSRRFVASRRLTTERSTIIWSALGDTLEVYDRRSDPRETFNLAGADGTLLRRAATELAKRVPPTLPPGPLHDTPDTLDQLRSLGYVE